jgi:hypothetical protein
MAPQIERGAPLVIERVPEPDVSAIAARSLGNFKHVSILDIQEGFFESKILTNPHYML